ncbi:MAG: sugar ABC transporter substrate-binding protein [Chloroflexi bacterium]|nr:sugar ABC transporter substrate-binding protein [Chloroflexota bacterium]
MQQPLWSRWTIPSGSSRRHPVMPRRSLLATAVSTTVLGGLSLAACGRTAGTGVAQSTSAAPTATHTTQGSASTSTTARPAGSTQQTVLQGHASGKQVPLVINYYGALTYNTVMHEIAQGFLKEHPEVALHLNFVTASWQQQVETMIAGGVPPDIFRADPSDFYSFAGLGVYEPLDAYVSRDHYSFSDYWPHLREQYTWNGQLLNLPDMVNNLILWYNVDLFRKSGLEDPNALAARQQWTWQTALEAAQKLTSGHGPTKQYGIFLLLGPINYLLPWVWMAGGSLFNNEARPTKLTFDNPQALTALQWLADLYTKYDVAPRPIDLVGTNGGRMFYTGRVGMYVAQLDIQGMQQSITSFHWDCAPLPSGPAGMWNFFGGADFGVTKSGKQHALGWDLLKYITSPAGQAAYVKHELAIPMLQSVAQSKSWLDAPGSPPHKRVILDALLHSKPIPPTSAYTQLNSRVVQPNLSDLWNGKAAALQVADIIDQAGQPILAQAKQ